MVRGLYDENMTSASKSALVEVASALHIYRNDFILAGGWVPYFLTRQYFDHCGSKDIDLVLRPSVMPRYKSMRQIVERLGYSEVAGNPFRFERQVPSPIDKQMYRVELDFLTEPSAAQEVYPLVKIQHDLRACLIEGSSVVFKLNRRESVEGVLPGDGATSAEIRMASVASCLTMKGLALPRLSDKDSYDIYAVAGFCGGGPNQASQAFLDDLGSAQMEERELNALNNGLNRIRAAFKDADSQGPYAASRFSDQITRTESFMRVSTFLTGLPSMFR
jgi:hypothetical protein